MEIRDSVRAVLEATQSELMRLPRKYVIALGPVLGEVRQELIKGLNVLKKYDKESTFTAQHKRNVLANLDAALESVKKVEPVLFSVLNTGKSSAHKLANGDVLNDLAKFSRLYGAELKPINLELAGIVITGSGRIARKYASSVTADIRHQLTKGVIHGESFAQMTKRLTGDKLGSKYAYWAERIVRTEIIDAYNMQAQDSIKQIYKTDDRIRQIWNASLDRRTCYMCETLDGEVRSLGENFTGGIEAPPAHPNCRCILSAWREDWK